MLESISSLLEIGEKSPPAIDYFYMPPHQQWVPAIALKKAHQNQEFLLSLVGLHNLSSKVLPSIRIKLPFAPQYEPVVEATGVAMQYDSKIHEVQVGRLDPGEKVYVAIFLSTSEGAGFSEPQVIVGDRLLSRGMRAVGYFKTRQKESLLFGGLLILLLGALIFAGRTAYEVSPFNPKAEALKEATASLSGAGCIPTAYEKSQVNESLLARHRLGESLLLRLNNVVTRNDLFGKEYVVICEAR